MTPRKQVDATLNDLDRRDANLAQTATALDALQVRPKAGGLYPSNYRMLVDYCAGVLARPDVYTILGV